MGSTTDPTLADFVGQGVRDRNCAAPHRAEPRGDSLWIGVDGENDGYFGVQRLKRTVLRLSDVTGTNERTPVVVPSFQTAWTRSTPQLILIGTLHSW
jgi:hypothetical protein